MGKGLRCESGPGVLAQTPVVNLLCDFSEVAEPVCFQQEFTKTVMESTESKLPHCVSHTCTLYMDAYITPNYSYPKVKGCLERGNYYSKQDKETFFFISQGNIDICFLFPGKNRKVSSISELVYLPRGSK